MERRAVVLAASQRQWDFTAMSAAIRTAYPKQMPTANVHEAIPEEDEWLEPPPEPWAPAAEAETASVPDSVEAEINELLQEDGPIDEEDAIDILA
eukprot:4144432-Pyramimonas_sp.AAC.1